MAHEQQEGAACSMASSGASWGVQTIVQHQRDGNVI